MFNFCCRYSTVLMLFNHREVGQNSRDEVRSRDFRKELEDREGVAREKRSGRDRGQC